MKSYSTRAKAHAVGTAVISDYAHVTFVVTAEADGKFAPLFFVDPSHPEPITFALMPIVHRGFRAMAGRIPTAWQAGSPA